MDNKLTIEVANLISECEGYEDCLNYVSDIASDLGIDVEDVIVELKRQYNLDD